MTGRETPLKVARHRTAMVRHTLSQPMSLMVRFGLIGADTSVFDYGCGQGDDLRALRAGGIQARGWDPHFAPDAPLSDADVVNLGFVLNVIEAPDERMEALRGAWELTRAVLAVSTMIAGQVPVDGLKPFRDGYLTSRGTFQKYFQHAELRQLVSAALETEPVAAAPGVFLAFRRSEDADEFRLTRRSTRRASTMAYRSGRDRSGGRAGQPDLIERIGGALATICDLMMDRGREPQIDELARAVLDALAGEHVSLGRAIDLCREHLVSEEAYRDAQASRREELLIHRALSMLERRTVTEGSAIRRDVRALFGSRSELAEQAREYLFGLADAKRMEAAVAAATEAGLGIIDERGRIVFDARSLNALPGALRCYAGCATHLSGEPGGELVYRLDPVRRQVTLVPLDATGALLPTSSYDIRIDLKRQDVTIAPRRRRLLRGADLLALGARSKQRAAERRRRDEIGLDRTVIFEDLS